MNDLMFYNQVVMTEQSSDSRYVSGNALIFDGEDGAPSPFLELVRAQHLQDCLAVEKTVLECIQQVCGELLESHTGCPPGEVPVSKLREAMQLADPKKSRLEVNLLLARGAGCSLEALLLKEAKRVPVALEEFKANVVRGLLKKSPQAPAKKAK